MGFSCAEECGAAAAVLKAPLPLFTTTPRPVPPSLRPAAPLIHPLAHRHSPGGPWGPAAAGFSATPTLRRVESGRFPVLTGGPRSLLGLGGSAKKDPPPWPPLGARPEPVSVQAPSPGARKAAQTDPVHPQTSPGQEHCPPMPTQSPRQHAPTLIWGLGRDARSCTRSGAGMAELRTRGPGGGRGMPRGGAWVGVVRGGPAPPSSGTPPPPSRPPQSQHLPWPAPGGVPRPPGSTPSGGANRQGRSGGKSLSFGAYSGAMTRSASSAERHWFSWICSSTVSGSGR